MEHENLAPSAKQLLAQARRQAVLLGHEHLGTEHMMLAMIARGQEAAGADVRADFVGLARQALGEIEPINIRFRRMAARGLERSAPQTSPRLSTALGYARIRAEASGAEAISDRHVMLGILDEGQGVGMALLERLGVDPEQLRRRLGEAGGSS